MGGVTKDRVKQVAFSLFAADGYEATTMNKIASGVGIKKPSLYAYFSGKEELFLSIYEELEEDYRRHMMRVIDETQGMAGIEDRLFHIFVSYLDYFAKDPEVSAFWNRILFFPPSVLKDQLILRITKLEEGFQARIRPFFSSGMNQGIIRPALVDDTLLSFYCMREGLLLAMMINPGLDRRKIRTVWEDYWLGIKGN